MIQPITLRFSNAYLIRGDKPLLVDTGSPGEEDAIEVGLQRAGVNTDDLGLILHTHVHSDHVGSTAALTERGDVPTAHHAADCELMRRGINGELTGTTWRGSVMARFFTNTSFPTFTATHLVEDGQRLDAYGVAGRILHTPGHTPGSISVLLDAGHFVHQAAADEVNRVLLAWLGE